MTKSIIYKPVIILVLLALLFGSLAPAIDVVSAQPAANGITSPTAGAILRGTVSVQGVAAHPAFRKWQIDLLPNGDADQATFLAVGETPAPQPSELFVFDTTPYPDGQHTLRLRVVRADTNYDEYFTAILIANQIPVNAPAPVLLTTDPANGAAWDGGPVTFTFDKPLAAAQILVSPALEGATSVGGADAIFTPTAPPTAGVRYRFTVADAAAEDGTALASAPTVVLTAAGAAGVAATQPADGAEEADANAPIVVLFSRPMAPLTGIAEQSELPQPLTIDPPVDGAGEWISTSVYRFQPAQPLAGATTYRVDVAALPDAAGQSMSAPYTFSFTTAAPIVLSAKPSGIFARPDATVRVTFSQPMDPASTEAAFSLVDQGAGESAVTAGGYPAPVSASPQAPAATGAPVAGSFTWNVTGTVLSFAPAALLTYGSRYTIAVAEDAQPASQQGRMRQASASSFTVVPLPAVLTTSILDGAAGVNPETELRVRFSAPVSDTTLLDSITISPPPISTTTVVSYTYTDYYENTQQNQTAIDRVIPFGYNTHLMLNWYREPNTAYTVTIGGGVTDEFGNTLGEDFVTSFTTSEYPPLTQLDLDRFTHYSAHTAPIVGVRYRNVDTVDAQLYRLPLRDLYTLGGQNSWSVWDTYQVPDRAQNLIWSKSAPGEGERNVVNVLGFTIADADGAPLPPGPYLLEVRNPVVAGPDTSMNAQMQRAVIILTNRNITFKRGLEGQSLAWLTDLQTGEPAADAAVVFTQEGETLGEATTDADGAATAPLAIPPNLSYAPVFATSGAPGDADFAVVSTEWNQGIEAWSFGVPTGGSYDQSLLTLYTERPIYRPGQTVFWKGIYRVVENDQWRVPPADAPIQVRVTDGMGNLIVEDSYPINEFGTIDGQFTLAPDAPTGFYSINASVGPADMVNASGGAGFQVAAYRAPEFEIVVKTDQPEYIQGDTIQLQVQANYFSGGALANAPVEWRLLASPYSFTWRAAPDGRYYAFDPFDPDQADYSPYTMGNLGLVQEGRGMTDASGAFTVEIPADLGDARGSQQWTFDVVITSPTQQQVFNSVSAPVHRGAYYIGLAPRSYVAVAGEETTVDAVTVTPDGARYPEAALDVVVYEFRWNNVYEQAEDGNFYWKSSAERTPVYSTTVTTDDLGEAAIAFTPAAGGQYQVTALGADAAGNQIASAVFLWVSDSTSAYIPWRLDNDDRIDLVADKKLYAPGDTARILVPNPFTGTVKALVTLERSGVLEHQVIDLSGSSQTIDLPITSAHIPNVYVSVVLVKGVDESNPYPATRVGYVKLPVDTAEKELSVTATPSAEVLRPGDIVTYTLTVRDHTGAPAAEVETSVALVDKAVLSLAYGDTRPLVDIFYYERPLGVIMGSLIAINKDRVSQQLAEGGKGGGGGGGGPEVDVREQFADTAFWRADLVTDENGEIQFAVQLPDNLTTWVLTAKSVDEATLVGETTDEIVTTKELQVRPGLPRFFTAGDRALIGGTVVNFAESAVSDGVFTFAVEGATVATDQTEQSFTLGASGDSANFAFPVSVDGASAVVTVTMTAVATTADGATLTDGVRIPIPVQRYQTPETVGTSGVVPPEGVTEAIYVPATATDDGALTVTLDPSLAAGMVEGLTYLEHYPYECIEQTVSRFLPNLFTVRALRELGLSDPELENALAYQLGIGVQRLVSNQNPDGGWGYWPQQSSSAFVTAYVLWGLWHADQMGYAVDENVLNRAATYLDSQFSAVDGAQAWQLNEMAFMHYVLAQMDKGDPGRMSTLYAVRERLAYYGQALLAMALHEGSAEDARAQTLLDGLTGAAILTAAGASWQEQGVDYQTMNTDTRSTALVLDAFLQVQPDSPILPNVVRWLMTVRSAGRWASTQENAWSIIALTDYMAHTGELAADYGWTATLNEEELGSGRFEDYNDQVVLRTAVADLLRGEANLLRLERTAEPGQLYYTTYLAYNLDALAVAPLDRGIVVQRRFADAGGPISTARVGDVFSVTVTIVAPTDLYHLQVEAPIPAGVEALDPNLPTGFQYDPMGQPILQPVDAAAGGWWNWTPAAIDYRDDKVALFATYLPAGTYAYTFQVRATLPGEYRVLPAHGEMMYFPEVWGRSGGELFTVSE
jgi:uncharacterized protein YfaS (alpha-2-macroglobulin family)